jgi:hypothetical protein
LLLVFLVGATPAAPALAAFVALADGGHRVVIEETARGIRVVLGHDGAHSPGHRHGLVARALTLVAERPAGPRPDHVLQFSSAPASDRNRAAALTGAPDLPVRHPLSPFVPLSGSSGTLLQLAMHLSVPPGDGLLLSLRSTVLIL